MNKIKMLWKNLKALLCEHEEVKWLSDETEYGSFCKRCKVYIHYTSWDRRYTLYGKFHK